MKHITYQDVAFFKNWWQDFFKKKVLLQETYGKQISKEQKTQFAVNKFYELLFMSEEPGVVVAKPYIDSLVQHFYRKHASRAHINLKETQFIKENFLLLQKNARHQETVSVHS